MLNCNDSKAKFNQCISTFENFNLNCKVKKRTQKCASILEDAQKTQDECKLLQDKLNSQMAEADYNGDKELDERKKELLINSISHLHRSQI
jgi:hypothetical protein